jgi:FkbM family methyltransferase
MTGRTASLSGPAVRSRDAALRHWAWVLRKQRASLANRLGRPFTYRHPVLGRFIYHPADDLSRHVLLHEYESAALGFAAEQAGRGGVAVDVGANIGVFTAACARALGPGGRVVALEPAPATFEKLQITCARLKLQNVETLRVAAAGNAGRRPFVVSGVHELRQHLADRRDAAAASVEVDTARLDDLCGGDVRAVCLLKIDVEGHECEVLAGAERILNNRRCGLIVEFFPAGLRAAGTSVDELWTMLARTHDCRGVVSADGASLPARPASIAGSSAEAFNSFWTPSSPW